MVNRKAVKRGQRAVDHGALRTVVRRVLPSDSLPRRVWARVKPAETVRTGSATVRRSDFDVMVDVADATDTRGVYLYGGCDAERLLDMGEYLAPRLTHSLGIKYSGHVSTSRPDVLLQKLQGVAPEDTEEVRERLNLSPDYFEPDFFEPKFTLGRLESEPIQKHAVVTNIAAAVTRTLYRHKTKGFLVDPGGWWLAQTLEGVVPDRETMKWFRKNFTGVGRMTVDEWEQDFRRLLTETVTRTGANVLALNLLTVEPEDPTHSYSGRSAPETVRRREFALRLMELSQEIGVGLIDADRLLKESGVRGAVDFAHMPREQMQPVMRESAELLVQRGVLKTTDGRRADARRNQGEETT